MAMVILNVIGQCGPFLGTNVFPDADNPRYIRGLSICAAFMFFTTFLALSLRTLLAWENRRLDKQYGTQTEQASQQDGGEKILYHEAEENYGVNYRFVL
jgi:hypothetical protein